MHIVEDEMKVLLLLLLIWVRHVAGGTMHENASRPTFAMNHSVLTNSSSFERATGNSLPSVHHNDAIITSHQWLLLLTIPLILFTVSGNLLVCTVVARVPKLQTVNNIFLTSLAIADLMVAILVMPMGLVKDLYGFWPSTALFCVLWNTFDVLCCTASILHICVIALDRYLAICDPIRFQQSRKSHSRTRIKILLVWLMSFAQCSPLLILGLSDYEGFINYTSCTIESRKFKLYGSAISFLIPLGIIVTTYLLTALTLCKRTIRRTNYSMSRKGEPHKGSSSSSSSELQTVTVTDSPPNGVPDIIIGLIDDSKNTTTGKEYCKITPAGKNIPSVRSVPGDRRRKYHFKKPRKKQKANLVLFLVFTIFVLAWTPFFIVNILFSFYDDARVNADVLFSALTWLGWASSCLNPIIYTIFNTDFRRAFLCVLTFQWKRLGSYSNAMDIHQKAQAYRTYQCPSFDSYFYQTKRNSSCI